MNIKIIFKLIKRQNLFFVLLTLKILLISGCTSLSNQFNVPLDAPVHSKALLKQDYYTVKIPSFDGTELKATIYQPALAPNETAPVIIHAHGFGMFRMPRPMSLYGQMIFSGMAAKKAWENGYWVISYDQRGHGQSRGSIEMMDPQVEVQDLRRILDWIEENLPRIKYEKNNLVVGMIGESYGGGVQLLGASMDDRIDAIVPITTWHDFADALTPSHVVKSGWLTTLIAVGNVMNPTTMNSSVNKAFLQSLTGKIPSQFEAMMQVRSMSDACYCQADNFPHADAFFIQGLSDVLFPVNEAVKNANCLEAVGRDVRLLATQNGHLLPMTQFAKSLPGYDVDTQVTCDDQTHRTDDLVLAWFDEKLKGQKGRADIIPKVCMTHDKKSGTSFDAVPVGGMTFNVPSIGVRSGMAGLFELPFSVFDHIGNILMPKRSLETIQHQHNLLKTKGGEAPNKSTFRPAFLPLYVAEGESNIAGIPVGRFDVSGDTNDILFVGIGLKKNGQLHPQLMSDQIYPIRGGSKQRLELPAVSSRLNTGDVVGLIVAGYSNQYRLSSRIATNAVLFGEIDIPIHE